MRKLFLHVLAVAAILSSCSAKVEKQDADFTLSDGWTIHADGSEETYAAKVPSTVLGTLTGNGKYADAFVGTNYDKVMDREEFSKPWWYENEFSLPALKNGQRVTLDFEGICYSAEVWFNGELLASREEMEGPFRQFRFDVTDKVAANNSLKVKLFRAEDGDFNIGFVDWNPRAADESMGVFRPVWVRYSDAVSVSDVAVKSNVNVETLKSATLAVEAKLSNSSSEPVEGKLTIKMEGKSFDKKVSLAAGETKIVTVGSDEASMLDVKNPRLWWCHNLGKPEMYHMDVAFVVGNKESGARGVDFGIRQIDTYFTEEGHRGFILNGKKVLLKGAGWTDDIFLRNPDSRNDIELEYVKDMGLNTVRFENIWGTSQNVYDLCDRKGLFALVGWSCFWEWETYSRVPNDQYGCIKTEEDMDLIAASLKDQVLWLRNHPSIVAWYVGSDDLPRPALEERYLKILPEIDNRPYIASAKGLMSSVSGPTGMKMVGPYDYQAPEYWYNPRAAGGAFGFNTETGIGAQLPVRESIEKMIPQDELWPVGKAYDYHCTVAGEDMHSLDVLKDCIEKRYGEASNLDEFLLRAHHLDYDGTRAMFEGFRVNNGRATGVIQWMLNSAWPSLYWQLYDWYLQPVASYYSVKKALAPQQLVYNYYDNCVYAVCDENSDVVLTSDVWIVGLDGRQILHQQSQSDFGECQSYKLFELPECEELSFMFLSLTDSKGNEVASNEYVLSPVKDIHNYRRYNWIRTPLKQHADYTALSELKPAEVGASVKKTAGGLAVELKNNSDVVAFFVRMALKDASGELVTPAFWSDNFVSLMPGETKTYSCAASGAEGNCLEISGWNVAKTSLNY